MNKREIEKQALNSLNTYFKDNPDKVLNIPYRDLL